MDKYCRKCGSMLVNGVCNVCTLNQQTIYEQFQNNNQNIENVHTNINKKTQRKNPQFKLFGLILFAILIITGLIIAWFLLFKGRDVEETIEMYEKAVKEQDEESIIELMLPKEVIESNRDIARELENKLDDTLDKLDEKNIRLKSIEIKQQREVDEALMEDIDEEFFEVFEFKNKCKEAKILTVTSKVKDKENGNIIENDVDIFAYKIGNKWYIYPDLLEYIDNKYQTMDYNTAKNIYFAIDYALVDENIRNIMKPYYGIKISLDDFSYLPEEFRDKFISHYNIVDDVPRVRYTKNGANGYSFEILKDGSIVVYISTEQVIGKWSMYPTTDDSYYSNTKDEGVVSIEEVYNDIDYVKYISEKSSLLGNWQCENAGMYIGYNTSEYNEGFVVYVYTSASWQVYNYHRLNSSISWDGYAIQFVNNKDHSVLKLYITDENNMIVNLDGLTSGSYSFTKGNINSDVANKFAGEWKGCFRDQTYNITYDGKLAYDTEHSHSNSEVIEEDGILRKPSIVLYNGNNSIVFVNTYTNKPEWYDFEVEIPIQLHLFTLQNDENIMSTYAEYDMIPEPKSVLYYKVGTEYQEYWNAITEYKKLADQQKTHKEVSLIYLDDNDIPELILWETGKMYTYMDGQIAQIDCQQLEYLAGDVVGWFKYKPRESKLLIHRHPSDYYKSYKNLSTTTQYFYSSMVLDGPRCFAGENAEIPLEDDEYEKQLESNGYTDMVEPEKYQSVEDAYYEMEGYYDYMP